MLSQITRNRQSDQREDVREGLTRAMGVAANPDALREEFNALDSSWTAPDKTGFEPTSHAA